MNMTLRPQQKNSHRQGHRSLQQRPNHWQSGRQIDAEQNQSHHTYDDRPEPNERTLSSDVKPDVNSARAHDGIEGRERAGEVTDNGSVRQRAQPNELVAGIHPRVREKDGWYREQPSDTRESQDDYDDEF